MMIKLNVIIRFAFVAVLTTVFASGCDDVCKKTEYVGTLNYSFAIRAKITGPNGSEIAGKTIEIRAYKEPCGELPKGHFGWTNITDEYGYANGGFAAYNINNDEDVVVFTATLVDGENTQTKTEVYKGSNMGYNFCTSASCGLPNLIEFVFTP